MMKKGDNFPMDNESFFDIEQSRQVQDEVFQELSPGELQNLLDRDEAERLGHSSISIREVERSGIQPSSSTKKKIPDFSMGQYFEHRSSFPFPSLNGNITTLNDPIDPLYPQDLPVKDKKDIRTINLEETIPTNGFSVGSFRGLNSYNSIADTPQVNQKTIKVGSQRSQWMNSLSSGTTALQESITQSMEEQNGSISSLVQFFADPNKSPMSSTDIMDHVLQYCKTRSSSQNLKSIQKNSQGRTIDSNHSMLTTQSFAKTYEISHIADIEQSRKVRESDNYNVFSKVSSKKVQPSSMFMDESKQSDSEAYKNFSQKLTQPLRLSRCSTPDTNSACSSRNQSRKSSESSIPNRTDSSCSSNGSQASKSKTLTEPTNMNTLENVNPIQRSLESDFQNCLTMSTMSISKTVNVCERNKKATNLRNKPQVPTMQIQHHQSSQQLQASNVNVMQAIPQQPQFDNQQQQNPVQVQLNLPMQPPSSNSGPMQNLPLVINITMPSMMMPPGPTSTDSNGNHQSQPRLSLQFSGTVQWHQ